MLEATRADEEPRGGGRSLIELLTTPRSYWGDAIIYIYIDDDTPRSYWGGGGGRSYRVDDTEELPGDAILYCDGASIYIFGRARQYIFGRARLYIYIYIYRVYLE